MKNLSLINFCSLVIVIVINLMIVGGFLNILYPIYSYIILTVLIVLFGYYLFLSKNITINSFKHFRNQISVFEKIIILIIAIYFLASFFCSFAPITGVDELTSRLNNPKRYLINHSFLNLPHSLNSNLPMAAEMYYMFILSIFPEYFTRLGSLLINILLILTIYNFTQQYFSTKIAILSIFLIISTQTFFSLTFTPLNDMLFALFSMLTLQNMWKFKSKSQNKYLILFGLFAGMVVSTKFSGFVYVITLYLIMSFYLFKIKQLTKLIIPVIISFIIYLPWLVKAYIYTENPFYPVLCSIFQHSYPYSILPNLTPPKINFNIIEIILYPFIWIWNVSFYPLTIDKYYSPLTQSINPFIAILLFVSIYLKYWRNQKLREMTFIVISTYLIHAYLLMGMLGPRVRYIYICVILTSIIGSWGYYHFDGDYLKRYLAISIAGWGVVFLIITSITMYPYQKYLFSNRSVEEFHNKSKPGFKWFADFEYLNRICEENEKVLLFHPKAYYLDPDYVLARRVKYMIHLSKSSKAEDLFNYLKRNNVKYIWFDNDKNDLQHYDRELLPLTKKMIDQYKLQRHYFNEDTNSYIYGLDK